MLSSWVIWLLLLVNNLQRFGTTFSSEPWESFPPVLPNGYSKRSLLSLVTCSLPGAWLAGDNWNPFLARTTTWPQRGRRRRAMRTSSHSTPTAYSGAKNVNQNDW